MDKELAWVYEPTDEETTTFAGGVPYLCPTKEWPMGEDGRPLRFLFQADLSEVGDIGLNLPKDGFLQFFTHADDLYGMDMDHGNDYKSGSLAMVRWTDEVRNLPEFELPQDFENKNDESPLNHPNTRAYFTGSLYRGGDAVDGPDFEQYEFYLGGLPVFTQDDFRHHSDPLTLLLGSNSARTVMWGDSGSAGFWMNDIDAANQDYRESFLYWDCY